MSDQYFYGAPTLRCGLAIKMIFSNKFAFPEMAALAGLCRIEVADLGSNDHEKFKVPPVTRARPHGTRLSSRLLHPARARICRSR